ncbi:hypothetical protein DIPPA_00315 [Diplonema papillatum]|nr:hypothetical protein DIPPA_00315 [Diplonema papillatum]
MSVIVAASLVTDGSTSDELQGDVTGVALAVVSKDTKSVLVEKVFEVGAGAMAETIRAMDQFILGLSRKPGFVCETQRLFRKELPRLPQAVKDSLATHWQRYFDLPREVERSYSVKCSGLLATMLTVGIDPVGTSLGAERARAMADVIVQLLKKGNDFKRPMAAGPSKPEGADADDDGKASKKKSRKKRKRGEDADDAPPAPAPEEPQEPVEPPPKPSLFLLRETLFLSALARAESERFESLAHAVTAKLPVTPSPYFCAARVPDSYAGSAAWTALTGCFILKHLNKYPAVLVVPNVGAAMEAAALLTDLNITTQLILGAPVLGGGSEPAPEAAAPQKKAPPQKKKGAPPPDMPARSAEPALVSASPLPSVSVVLEACANAFLAVVPPTAAVEAAVAVAPAGPPAARLKSLAAHLRMRSIPMVCIGGSAAAAELADVYCAKKSKKPAQNSVAVDLDIPMPPPSVETEEVGDTSSGLPLCELKPDAASDEPAGDGARELAEAYDAGLGSWGQEAVRLGSRVGDYAGMAAVLKEMFSDAKTAGAWTPALTCVFYALLAGTSSGVTAPVTEPCTKLLTFHDAAAAVLLEVYHSAFSGDQSDASNHKFVKYISSASRVLLSIPLLPAFTVSPSKTSTELSAMKNNPGALFRMAVATTLSRVLQDIEVDNIADLWCTPALTRAQESKHAVRHGKRHALFLSHLEAALLYRLKGEHLGVPVDVLNAGCSWDKLLKENYGAFPKFVNACKGSFVADRKDGVTVLSMVVGTHASFSVTTLPSSGKKNEEARAMARCAIEELLTVLPRGTRAAMLSSVGVTISGWNRFNNRHNRLLGATLNGFLLRHPEHFSIVATGRAVRRTDPASSPSFTTELRHGGRDKDEEDMASKNQKKRKLGSRRDKIHSVISDKWKRKQARKNNLRSAKIQKIPGFGKKKEKYKGKGTTPHWMK